jgi:hypothetical protein
VPSVCRKYYLAIIKIVQVHVRLANASTTAEKAVGANANAVAVKIGVVHGFLVYMALVVDSNKNFHGVLVDAGNGKVLAATQMSMAAMEQSGMGINLMGPGMGMIQPGGTHGSWNDDGTPLDILMSCATNH